MIFTQSRGVRVRVKSESARGEGSGCWVVPALFSTPLPLLSPLPLPPFTTGCVNIHILHISFT